MNANIAELGNPDSIGVAKLEGFIGGSLLEQIQTEVNDSQAVPWRDDHSVYRNNFDKLIIQNHFTYALKLPGADQKPLERIPRSVVAAAKVCAAVETLGLKYPFLLDQWQVNELSFHRYDDAEVGLSYHFDQSIFKGVIAILSVEGSCDFKFRNLKQTLEGCLTTNPGDLFLLRGTGLVESDQDLRPEHAVVNLRTPTRTSMMLRHNSEPHKRLKGFKFDNWP